MDRLNAFFSAYPLMGVYFFCSCEAVAAMLIMRTPRSAVWILASLAVAAAVVIPASGLI